MVPTGEIRQHPSAPSTPLHPGLRARSCPHPGVVEKALGLSPAITHAITHAIFHTAAPGADSRGADLTDLSEESHLLSASGLYSPVMVERARILTANWGSLLCETRSCEITDPKEARFTLATAIRIQGERGGRKNPLTDSSVSGFHGGANGIRTRDPHTASVVRYQLRHSPAFNSCKSTSHPVFYPNRQVVQLSPMHPLLLDPHGRSTHGTR